MLDYVGQLREGILEAYTGIVTGLKNTPKGTLLISVRIIILTLASVPILLPHAPSILELIYRCLSDEERTEPVVKLSYGLLGDLADSFPAGQLKPLLLQPWVASELRTRQRMSPETKKTMRWAREVCFFRLCFVVPPLNNDFRW